MKVSVIIPFYRGKKYLADCLQSLKEQYFEGMEVLLVMDPEAEDVSGLAEEMLPEINGKIIQLEDAHGVAAARNLGCTQAKGQYIYFLDSDDYVESQEKEDKRSLLHMYQLARQEDADIVYGKMEYTWFQRKLYLEGIVNADTPEEKMECIDVLHSSIRKDYYSDDYIRKYQKYAEILKTSGQETDAGKKAGRFLACHDLFVCKKDVSEVSILNVMIRKDFWEEKKITFFTEFQYYSDLHPVLMLLQYARTICEDRQVLYVKRRHNDPINLPALCQEAGDEEFTKRMQAYRYSFERLKPQGFLYAQLKLKLLNYYSNYFVTRMRRSQDAEWKGCYFDTLRELLGGLSFKKTEVSSRYKRMLLKELKHGNKGRIVLIASIRLAGKKVEISRKKSLEFRKYFYFHYFLRCPMKKNVILFESFLGRNYSDSPKYISEYLHRTYPGKYKLVWTLEDTKTEIGYPVTRVKRFSLRYLYYLACAKYFVYNGRQPLWMRKRKGQVFLETWHGTPLKKLVFDMEDVTSATPLYKKNVYNQAKGWDYLISPNKFSSEIFKSCFMFENTLLETGYPRNDILYAGNREEFVEKIRKKIGIPAGKKRILYAPTWRDDLYYEQGQYKFELKLDLKKMQKVLSDEYVILLRTHYFVENEIDLDGMEDFAINVSQYDDIAELYLISDLLITDYSSVFFDYANLRRPMIFFTYDLEKYRDILRGFYMDMEKEVPGPLVFDTDQVIECILQKEKLMEEYKERYDAFYQKYCGWEDGKATERVVNAMLSKNR